VWVRFPSPAPLYSFVIPYRRLFSIFGSNNCRLIPPTGRWGGRTDVERLSAAAHGADSTTAPGPLPPPARPAPAGSSAVSPWCPRPRPRSPPHRRQSAPAQGLSRRCARYRRPPPRPAASTRCRGLRRSPPRPPPRRRRPVPDRVRGDLADGDHEILHPAAGRPARTAHRAVTRRTGRRSSAPNRTPHGTGKPAAPARPASPTPGQAPKQAGRFPV
jgi:hypothetical protein